MKYVPGVQILDKFKLVAMQVVNPDRRVNEYHS